MECKLNLALICYIFIYISLGFRRLRLLWASVLSKKIDIFLSPLKIALSSNSESRLDDVLIHLSQRLFNPAFKPWPRSPWPPCQQGLGYWSQILDPRASSSAWYYRKSALLESTRFAVCLSSNKSQGSRLHVHAWQKGVDYRVSISPGRTQRPCVHVSHTFAIFGHDNLGAKGVLLGLSDKFSE